MSGYAFPHTAVDERRRLELLEQRLDPLTIRRFADVGLHPGIRCLEVGGGSGSIARWLSEFVGPEGHVTATDLEPDFLSELSVPNLEVLRHDVTRDDFPPESFDLIHARAVVMHVAPRMETLRRMVSWLAPGGWLVVDAAADSPAGTRERWCRRGGRHRAPRNADGGVLSAEPAGDRGGPDRERVRYA